MEKSIGTAQSQMVLQENCSNVSKATALGWTYKTELEDGIRLSYEDFLNNPMRAEDNGETL